MKAIFATLTVGLVLLVTGCAAWFNQGGIRHSASLVNYLYPSAKQPPAMQPSVTYLRPPVRVGIAFVPGGAWNDAIPEQEKTKLLERVKNAFSQYDYIESIEVIPTQYLAPKGGFTNLEQVGRMFNVELMTLLSYDQVQFDDPNNLSMLYWTIIGAYLVKGDRYDTRTMVDASVFDINSRKLLFRAPGTSQVKGSASLVGYGEKARKSRLEGYNKAVAELIPALQAELANFKERIKSDSAFKVENKPGYKAGGDLGWLSIFLLLGFVGYSYGSHRSR